MILHVPMCKRSLIYSIFVIEQVKNLFNFLMVTAKPYAVCFSEISPTAQPPLTSAHLTPLKKVSTG